MPCQRSVDAKCGIDRRGDRLDQQLRKERHHEDAGDQQILRDQERHRRLRDGRLCGACADRGKSPGRSAPCRESRRRSRAASCSAGPYQPFSIIALSSSHLPPKPVSGGSPDIATIAIAAAAKVNGMARARPPSSASSARAGAQDDRGGDEEQDALHHQVVGDEIERRDPAEMAHQARSRSRCSRAGSCWNRRACA